MKPTPFDPDLDLPPLPFDARICELAARLKTAGLPWRPHVGCFVWDRDYHIAVPSPFPHRIYFILNLGHFLQILGTMEDIQAKLIWLPTWHQARLLAAKYSVPPEAVARIFQQGPALPPGDELLALYDILLQVCGRT
jgi:hypothetical protein